MVWYIVVEIWKIPLLKVPKWNKLLKPGLQIEKMDELTAPGISPFSIFRLLPGFSEKLCWNSSLLDSSIHLFRRAGRGVVGVCLKAWILFGFQVLLVFKVLFLHNFFQHISIIKNFVYFFKSKSNFSFILKWEIWNNL